MASSVVFKLACLVLACMVVTGFGPNMSEAAAMTCNQVVSYLSPCISYVTSGGAVLASCCNGIRSLYSQAQTSADRQNVCACLKRALNGIPYTAYNVGLAAGLPAKCGLNIPYNISPSTDCKSVK